MKWIKKGHIYKPTGELEWAKEYAQIPRPLLLKDRIRIFYATRYYDQNDYPISQTSFIDVDKYDLTKILYIHEDLSLELGDNGSFSQYGIHPTMLLNRKKELLFYYQGWKRLKHFPYETAIGLALSNDNGLTFKKYGELPIFQKTDEDPYFVNGVFIMSYENKFVMFYSGGINWIKDNGKLESVYIIKSATSTDLITWTKSNLSIIDPISNNECQNTPTVLKIGNLYHMWFSYREATDFRGKERGYRIGYACSHDLIKWTRDDSKAGIEISEQESWDSQMVCYPYVFEIEGRILMLYCGNYFGKAGFGFAELKINK